jgi:hypothetical protein
VGISTGDIASLPGVRKQIPLSKEQLAKNKKAVEEKTKAENAKIIKDRQDRIKASEEAKKKPFSAKRLAEETQATGDKFRLFPNDPNSFIDDYLNPGVAIGNMASGLGSIPYDVQQGNYGKAAMSVAVPLLTGALGGIGAKNAKEFANNLVNPLAGVKDAIKSFGKKSLKLDKYSEIVDPDTGTSKIIYNLMQGDPLPHERYSDILPNDIDYYIWASKIYPGLEQYVSVPELRAAHKKSIEYFKKSALTGEGGKEHGLFIRNILKDKIPEFTNPIMRNAAGEQITRYNLQNKAYNLVLRDPIKGILEKSEYDVSKLTPQDLNIIDAYTNGYDKSINELLRGTPPDEIWGTSPQKAARTFYKDQGDLLKEAVLKNKSKEPFQVVRGSYDYEVDLLDSKTFKPIGKRVKRSELNKGDVFKDESFMSTSAANQSNTLGTSFGVRDASELIDIPGGSKQSIAIPEASSFPQYPGEKEVILPPKLVRRVEEIFSPNESMGYRFKTSILNPYALTGALGGTAAASAQQKKNGGWLDRYEDGGEFLGTTNKGFNYNGAWGGPSMQDGGDLTFLEPTSRKLTKGHLIPYADSSTELAVSIGGENGEPAYLVPSFKYGKRVEDPAAEFRRTGEHLGGPFKTYQEADEWERTVRHPYVEKGQNIPTPIKRSGKDFAMGGSLPGSVGFTYARTGSIPSNGPYAKKTMASAQNGKEMKYYQEGLDWKPRNISRDGSVIKDDRGQWAHPGEITEIDSPYITMEGVPYPVLGISDTGDTQMMYPGEDYEFDGETVTEYPIAQKGLEIPAPTTADSTRLFNAQMALNKFYENEMKAGRIKIAASEKFKPYYKGIYSIDDINKENLDFYRTEIKYRESMSGHNRGGNYDDSYNYHFNLTPNQVKKLELEGLAKTKSGSKYQQYYRDLITPQQNLASPFALTDSRIDPQRFITYEEVMNFKKDNKRKVDYPGGTVKVFDYDPLAIKPYHMRTPQEKIDWEKKYGKPKPQPKPKPVVKPEPVKEQPIKEIKKEQPKPIERKQNIYEGSPVYSPGTGSGLPSALIGFANQKGDTTYIKPEDYERFAVPKYGKEYIESKTTKKKNGGWLDKYK